MLRDFLFVGIGGGVGSMLRYAIALMLPREGQAFPWATLIVNLIGCLFIGLLAGLLPRYSWLAHTGWPLLAIGLCGGFTTFSAFGLDNVKLFQSGAELSAVLYTVASLALGIFLCYLGYMITSRDATELVH